MTVQFEAETRPVDGWVHITGKPDTQSNSIWDCPVKGKLGKEV